MSELIKLKINDSWVEARDYQIKAFKNYKNSHSDFYNYDNDHGIKFTISRTNNYTGIYMTREDGSATPIADWNNVKVFLTNKNPPNWYYAFNYQIWAYYDYIYSNDRIRKYKSYGTQKYDDYIFINVPNLQPNIVFTISRYDNNAIYYEKNDLNKTKVRISDNENARNGYLRHYHNMTDVIIPIIIQNPNPTPSLVTTGFIPIPPNVIIKATHDSDKQCIVCMHLEHNIKFLPCNHTNTCSICYVDLSDPKKCPMCRESITNIVKYTP